MAVEGEVLRAALRATSNEIGCQYRLGPEIGLDVDTLAALGLVKPIRQRIPDCAEHACPLRDGCRFAALFADARAGRSGKKYRLSPLGVAVLTDDALLGQVSAAARDLPLARRVLALLTAASGPQTIFALNAALLDECLTALEATGDCGDTAFTRAGLAACLTLLAATGAITYDGYHVALPTAVPSRAA
ncbi:MAG: hypothetical protein ACTHMP_24375 [Thermomicrobiales bacterium]